MAGAPVPQIGLIPKDFRPHCALPKWGITTQARRDRSEFMRGKRRGKLGLLLLPAALLGAGVAGAETAPQPPASRTSPTAIVVLDASKTMGDKLGGATKIAAVRAALGDAVAAYGDRLSFGLVAFGHRKASNCADSEILAKPGELTADTQSKLFEKIKTKGQAPIAAALGDATKG